jgi:hypothetical protein
MIVDKFQRGQVRALLRHLQGELTFHGAAAALEGRCVALLGASEAGKSSTAAALGKYRSAQFLTDDITPIVDREGSLFVVPYETHHWLTSDSIGSLGMGSGRDDSQKRPLPPTLRAVEPAELALVVQLEFDSQVEGPRLRALTGRAVFEALNHSAIRFIVDDQAVALHDFKRISELARQVPVFELRRPRVMGSLRACADIIADLLYSQKSSLDDQIENED